MADKPAFGSPAWRAKYTPAKKAAAAPVKAKAKPAGKHIVANHYPSSKPEQVGKKPAVKKTTAAPKSVAKPAVKKSRTFNAANFERMKRKVFKIPQQRSY